MVGAQREAGEGAHFALLRGNGAGAVNPYLALETAASLRDEGAYIPADIDDDELIRRLKDRGHDNEFITKRMELAAKQRNKIDEFDYVVDNKDINTTISKILNIIYKLEDS